MLLTVKRMLGISNQKVQRSLYYKMKKFFVVFAFCFVVVRGIGDIPVEEHDLEEARKALYNPDLYDGDIAGMDGPFDSERNAMPGTKYRWPNAVVPYVIDSSLNNAKNVINAGIQDYHASTCVKFVPRTNQKDFIKIFHGQGCYSMIGRVGGSQALSLGKGCVWKGLVVHELGHALGFYHEQSRSDRDQYLTIYLENVQKGMESQFAKLSPSRNILYTPFDHVSIMIYGNKAFSRNGQNTMIAKNGMKLTEPYKKSGLSTSDVLRVNKMYNCK